MKWGIPEGFNLWCFGGRIIVWGWLHPKLWGKYKKPKPRFHRFSYKNALKMIFSQIYHKYLLFLHIIVWFYHSLISLWFWTKTAKTNFEIFFQFSMSFHSKIYEILAWAFCIFPITLGQVDLQQRFDQQNTPNWSPQEFLIFLSKILAGSGENWKKRGGSNFFHLVPMLKNEIFFSVFHDVAISSFVQYQFQITKM